MMDKNSNNYYLKNINNKIKKLDLKKGQYEAGLINQNNDLEINISTIQTLKFNSEILHEQYNSLIRLLQKEGIVFEINFSKYSPHQWENLFLVKVKNQYEIQTKTGSFLMMIDDDFLKIIHDISKRDCHSLIVIRVTDKVALVQLRFI